MQKRGSRFLRSRRAVATELLLEAMQALAVMLVLSGAIVFVNNELDKSGFAKAFYARDMALMTTALYSAPENVFYLYYVKTVKEDDPGRHLFEFLISNNTVRVNATHAVSPVFYWYFSDPLFEGISYHESKRLGIVKFVKEGNRIDIGLDASANGNVISCPVVNTRDQAWHTNNLIINPAGGDSATDLGGVNKEDKSFYEEERTLAIASNDGFKKMRVGENRRLTRGETTGQRYISFEEKANFVNENAAGGDIVLSIHTGDNDDASINYIKAYYNSESSDNVRIRSRKLGCSILNSILLKGDLENKGRINGIAVIPSDSAYITRMIPSGRTGVLLELGNIQVPKSQNFLSDTSDLAEAIYVGIDNYYTK